MAFAGNIGPWDIENFCSLHNLKFLMIDSLSNYKYVKETLPHLEVLQLDVEHLACSDLRKVYCVLWRQNIQLDSSTKSIDCEYFRRYLHFYNNIRWEDVDFSNPNIVEVSHWLVKF